MLNQSIMLLCCEHIKDVARHNGSAKSSVTGIVIGIPDLTKFTFCSKQ